MELTKYGHSCLTVQLDVAGRPVRLCLDPGTLSESEAALEGADAILITHGHPDHLNDDVVAAFLIANDAVRLYGPHDALARLAAREDARSFADRLVVLGADEDVDVLGVSVRTLGGQHALIHPLLKTIDNLGYIIEGRVYHPGDSLVVPAGPATLEVLLVPVWAPWSKTSEVVDFIAAVRAKRAYGIHDAPLQPSAHAIIGSQLSGLGGRTGSVYEQWAAGESITVGEQA